VTRRRLDSELVRRGLATSRTEAQEAVLAGLVRVGGSVATKSSTLVADDQALDITGATRRYVSRGGEKLGAALDRSGIDPAGLDCLDVGASTGGFTDRLLQGGARHVVAVDVGYGQLAWSLRTDERVTALERTNARDLSIDALPFRPALIVVDVSFISLGAVMPALASVAAGGAHAVFLIKPQFEAGRGEVGRGGVVRDPEIWSRVISSVVGAASEAGFAPQGVMPSPVRGPAGNVEFLLWARRDAAPGELDLAAVVAEGMEVAA
jgi:23S rRNA (cytidine1920-2'-O)/16S rRNA (cytidine1409-2'-O)-methyltransferase